MIENYLISFLAGIIFGVIYAWSNVAYEIMKSEGEQSIEKKEVDYGGIKIIKVKV